jgi:ABC-type Na+ efflux pump permease subunit
MGSEKTEKTIEHPLEDFFGIEEGTTNVPTIQRTTELVEATVYDDKDTEVDEQFQEVYDIALEAFEAQAEEAELVEGKYRARNHEIAAQYLTIALNAANSKGTLKGNRDKNRINELKLAQSQKGPIESKDGMITGNRNDIMKALMEAKVLSEQKKPIDMDD